MNIGIDNIGIDLGMGAIKMYSGGIQSILPSFCSIATRDELIAGEGLTSSKTMKIRIGDKNFYVGRNAHTHGKPIENLDYDRLRGTPEIKALMYGCLHQMFKVDQMPAAANVSVGLPIETLTGCEARTTASEVRAWLVGNHEWSVGRSKRNITISDVKITHQPGGALMDFLLDDNGKLARKPGEIGIISVGFNTTEILVVNGKEINQSMSSGGTHGVRRLLELSNPQGTYTLGELDKAMRSGMTDEIRSNIPIWLSEVKGEIDRVWGNRWKRFNNIILVGGGSIILRNELLFDGKATMPDDPIISISRGLWKAMK